jgi:GDP-4-dehydro-6-deoxy-D-mannose reductase
MSNVGQSWKAPVESFTNNTNIFLNLLDPIRKHGLETKVLSVGSSEEYGLVQESDLPLTESKPLRPGSPYGVARVAQEQLSQVFAEGYGLDVVMTRSFNHIGPGQREQFVIPSFVKQVVEAKRAGKTRIILRAGNTRVVRDFLDVRDVVRAYHELLARGTKGQVYNICSGVGRSLDQVLEILSELTGVVVELEVDPGLVRPNELMTMIGSAHKLHQELGWTPRHEFRASLNDMIDYWNLRLQEIGERLP